MIIRSEQEMLDYGQKFAKNTFLASDGFSGEPPNQRIWGKEKPAGPAKGASVIELIGDVGAGKTTFTRGVAEGLGVKNPITSPSFTISKQYVLKNGGRLIHYDFYRLQNPGIMSEDLKENFENSKNIIIIEWANSVSDILPDNRIIIKFQKNDDDSRNVTIKNHSSDHHNTTAKSFNLPSNHTKPPKDSHVALNSAITGKDTQTKGASLKLYLDTSNPETILRLNDTKYTCNFGRDLAEKLLSWIQEKLQENDKTYQDITEITFMSGPGSFTGLRIGAAVFNTLAHELKIPLKDHRGNLLPIIIPDYGRPANISKPRK